MDWVKVTVQVDKESKEPVLGRLLDLGAGGVEETDPGAFLSLQESLSEECRLEGEPPQEELLTTYWPVGRKDEIVTKIMGTTGVQKVITSLISDTEWLNTQTIGFAELLVGKDWAIYPSQEGIKPTPGRRSIYIRPGQAFGTGLHPTTQLCLEALEEITVLGKALDAGTGSGILTVALNRMGFNPLVACDIDPTAVEVAAQNLRINKVDAELIVASPADLEESNFDLVVANILAEVIIGLMPDFARLVKPGGLLLCSGIIASKAEQVLGRLHRHGFAQISRWDKDNWVAILARLQGVES